ncbi:MAG: serine--tRNA ligase [Patescibacteria group bacterium]|nr:serine--tRNA ligase [Patescibacteria group bacterium]
MIDIKYLREHTEDVRANCVARRAKVDLDAILKVDTDYNVLLQEVEKIRADRNEIANQSKGGKPSEEMVEKGKKLKEELAAKEELLKDLEVKRALLLHAIPNLTHEAVPDGDGDEDNKVIRKIGEPAKLSEPLDHVALAAKHDLMDFERGAKVAGAKFYFLKNKLAILEQAVLRYGMDFMMREGYEFITTPDVAKEEVLIGKGFQPRGPEKQVYFIEDSDLALVGTAEIPMLGYHMNEVFEAELLPKKYVAFSHCFRTESGSYGRESYGLYRVHQFSKVEMFAFAKPEQSEAIHLEFLAMEEKFWQSLGIPYQVVDCASGDLGASDYRRYDIEAWMWGRNEGKGGYGEVTSASNCIDYQARGMNIKYKDKEGNKGLVHTLNGTVVAAPRALISILENYQQINGTIKIPDVLVPYCGFSEIG